MQVPTFRFADVAETIEVLRRDSTGGIVGNTFDMGTYFRKTDCGSVACLAGTTLLRVTGVMPEDWSFMSEWAQTPDEERLYDLFLMSHLALPHVILIFDSIKDGRFNLAGADLSGLNLPNARLDYANLRNANLEGSNLSLSELRHADLRGANLQKAKLMASDLSFADLRGADLRNADLHKANTYQTNLTGVNLSLTHMSESYGKPIGVFQ